MKFVFLVFFVSSFLCFTLLAKDIFIKASAKIYNNDIFEAKERVLKNAQLKAVKKGVEIFLVKKTINDNYQAIKEQIYNLNQNFINNFEIVYQDIHLDQPYIEVQIKASVAAGKIKEKLNNLVLDYRGSISAEHGIGRLKKDELYRYSEPTKLGLMRSIKNIFDPKHILKLD